MHGNESDPDETPDGLRQVRSGRVAFKAQKGLGLAAILNHWDCSTMLLSLVVQSGAHIQRMVGAGHLYNFCEKLKIILY